MKKIRKCGNRICKETKDLKTCLGCSCAEFCSRECQKIAWQGYHKVECKTLDFSFKQMARALSEYDDEIQKEMNMNNNNNNVHVEFTKDLGRVLIATRNFNIFDNVLMELPLVQYTSINMPFSLLAAYIYASDEKKKKVDTLFKLSQQDNQLIVHEILKKTSLLSRLPNLKLSFDDIFNILMIHHCNAHSYRGGTIGIVTESNIRFNKEYTSEYFALFELGSKVEHSCKPNVTYISALKQLKYIAISEIQAEERIKFSYGITLIEQPVHKRREILKKTKFFLCCCTRCSLQFDFSRPIFCMECNNKKKKGICLRKTKLVNNDENEQVEDGIWTCLVCKNVRNSDDPINIELEKSMEEKLDQNEFNLDQLKMVLKEITKKFPKYHFLHFKALKLLANSYANEAFHSKSENIFLWISSAETMLEVVTNREILQALYDGQITPEKVWIENNIDISNLAPYLDSGISDIFHTGMDFIKGKNIIRAGKLFSKYSSSLMEWLQENDPDILLVKNAIEKYVESK